MMREAGGCGTALSRYEYWRVKGVKGVVMLQM
jgi:hypothetical protein